MRRHHQCQWLAVAEFLDDAVVDPLVKNQRPVSTDCGLQSVILDVVAIERGEAQPRLIEPCQRRVGVEIDRGVEDKSAEAVAVWRQVGATSRKSKPQRRT